VCGALAGMSATAVVYPLDLTKTLLAIRIDKKNMLGIFGTMISIIKNQGFLALYKGLKATLIGIAPYASLKLTFY